MLTGLMLFLFGMRFMAQGLERSTGPFVERALAGVARYPLLGLMAGVLFTAVLQSSSAMTVIVLGLVHARLLSFTKALPVIMGANIGTTVTIQFLSTSIEEFSGYFLVLGVLLYLLGEKRVGHAGQIVTGFAILLVGMQGIQSGTAILKESSWIKEMLISAGEEPLKGVIFGIVVTTVVDSSSAAILMIQQLLRDGILSLEGALPILYGDNIGTTSATLVVSLTLNREARRVAIGHFLFNLIGTGLFLFFNPLVVGMVKMSALEVGRQLANAHTLFNLVNTMVLFPLRTGLVSLTYWLVPPVDREEELRV